MEGMCVYWFGLILRYQNKYENKTECGSLGDGVIRFLAARGIQLRKYCD
jgi:hypothetical protein